MSRDTTVLHVDDDSSFSDLTSTYLERSDASLSVISESSAQGGLEQLKQRSIDCIVSDYEMDDMDGLQFLEAIRNEYGTLPFVLYTGKGSEEIAEKAINTGADAYYQKEVGTGQYSVITQHINTLVEKQGATQRLDYLERKNHIADGGLQAADSNRTDEYDESVSKEVVKAVAAREGVDPVALTPPLYESINPEALDALFPQQSEKANQRAESATFTYKGYTITISGDGHVLLDK